jgi:hypothetical protein
MGERFERGDTMSCAQIFDALVMAGRIMDTKCRRSDVFLGCSELKVLDGPVGGD